jgi:AP-1 complex subunit beta-1
VVLAEKPVIADGGTVVDPSLLPELLHNIGSLASVYHKPPAAFVSRTRHSVARGADENDDEEEEEEEADAGVSGQGASSAAVAPMADLMGDLMALSPAAAAAPSAPAVDLLGELPSLPRVVHAGEPPRKVLGDTPARGLTGPAGRPWS